jgi:transposase
MKNSITRQSPKRKKERKQPKLTIGIDLGDKTSRYCVLDEDGEITKEASVRTKRQELVATFGRLGRQRIAIEVGTHSPWVSRLLASLGHEVIVANARQLKLITASSRKCDPLDARMLAQMARVDPRLLRPIRHRSERAQLDLVKIRVRARLVEMRTEAANSARGLAKALGERLSSVDTDQLGAGSLKQLTEPLRQPLQPLLESVEELTRKIRVLDKEIEQIAGERYPETELLTQVYGVGTLIALTFVLTIDDKQRFSQSRDVGCYLGLRPKRSDSGEREPQLAITKEGDVYLRKLLVQAAQCILRPRAPASDLRQAGERIAGNGSKNAKKRATVAVARKLAVLLHRLWVTGEVYEPMRNNSSQRAAA